MKNLRHTCSAAVLLLLLLSACSSAGASAAAPAVQSHPAPSEAPGQDAAQLDGTWVTPTVSRTAVTSALQSAGYGIHAPFVIENQGYPTAWTLVLDDGAYTVTSRVGVVVDKGSYSVDGSALTMIPFCPCTVTYGWRIEAGTLTLTLRRDESPLYRGIPDDAFQVALYTTSSFTRG